MEEFIEYQRFSTLEDAVPLLDLLDRNQIPFKVDDSANRFSLSATTIDPLENKFIVQIRQVDKDTVNKLNQRIGESPENDHYMYSLSNNDIIDAVVNPEDWTKEEQTLAQEIFKQRNLKPTAEEIKSTRKEKIEMVKNEHLRQKNMIRGGASWFLWIAILSILNIIALIANQNLQFIAGLGINYVILGVINGIQVVTGQNIMLIGYALAFLVSGSFVLIWKKSKKGNKAVYLTGLIIYALDTVIFIFTKEWFTVGFHVFAFIILISGYDALLTRIRESKR